MKHLISILSLTLIAGVAHAIPPSVPEPELAGLGLVTLGVALAVILRMRNR
jgi:hypothetical protein